MRYTFYASPTGRALANSIRADLLAIASDVDYWSRQRTPVPRYVISDIGARAARVASDIQDLLDHDIEL